MTESMQMENILAHGIFRSETEMTEMKCRKHSLYHNFSNLTFEEKDRNNSKMQTIEDVLKNMEINDNEEEFYSSINVTGSFSFEKDTPIENWLFNSVESSMGSTINLPLNWVEVIEVHKNNKWPLFVSLSIDRIEKERLTIPVAAFQFWEQNNFRKMLNEIMDKSAFYKFKPEEERTQGIVHLLIEMFKIRRKINMLNMYPEIADEYFQVKWNKPITGYQIIKRLCKLKSSGIKKMFKELPILECENNFAMAMNYLILALTAYKATAEIIFDRFVNVAVVCQVFKPLLKSQKFKNFKWSHQAIFNLLRSATNIFLMQTLGEYHELKSDMLDNEEYIIANIKEKDPKKKELKIIKWFMFIEVCSYPMHPSNFLNGNKVKKEGGIKMIRFKV